MSCNLVCVAWNVQSIRNKCAEVIEHVLDYKADVVFLCETWMEAEKNDITAMIKSRGYKLLHNRRVDREKEVGGGVGIMMKSTLTCKQLGGKAFSSFEHTMVNIKLTNNTKLVLVAIYRLQYIPPADFLSEFSELLEMLIVMEEDWVIAGDLNFHLETNDYNVTRLKDIFKTFNLTQYVQHPTHKLGHTLDCVLAPKEAPGIENVECNDVSLSDHFMITFNVSAMVQQHEYKTMTFRNLRSADTEKFESELESKLALLKVSLPALTMGQNVLEYNRTVQELVDEYFPWETKQIKIVPQAPWFDAEYKNLRKQRRKAEKKSRKSKLPEDKEAFISLRKQTTKLAMNKQKEYYSRKIRECNGQKEMFNCVRNLLDKGKESVLPEHTSPVELANQFSKYFKDKISTIRKSFPPSCKSGESVSTFTGEPLTQFEPATEDEVLSIIIKHGIKCAPDDPIPAKVLKTTYKVFIPIWTELANLSLSQGDMECLKGGVLLPLIKAMDSIMDCDVYKNYRPVTNLQFLGKLIERIVKIRFDSHLIKNDLNCKNQYGYKNEHSTEMLMTKVSNDLLIACDRKTPTLLMFLDLSAAFDTVDQDKLLQILEKELGIRGVALQWFESFLKGRTQRVKIGDSYSSEETLDFGVAQGSILGPPLFNAYTRTFPDHVKFSVKFSVEGYADDHQLQKQFNLVFQIEVLGENLEECFKVIDSWMQEYFLKLNATKTKIMIVAPPSIRQDIIINGTFINGKCIRFVDCAKNLGVLFDAEMTLEDQVNKVVSSCFSTIRLLSRVKFFLESEQLNTLVCSLIFSIMDYCNALYYGLKSETIDKLQRVQNSAARLVMKVNRFDRVHMNDLFEKLHWLRVRERIVYKVLLIVHKSVNKTAPVELTEMFRFVQSDRTRKLAINTSNGMIGQRAISVCGPKLWNALPKDLRLETSTDEFKKRLKTFLFKNIDKFYDIVYIK